MAKLEDMRAGHERISEFISCEASGFHLWEFIFEEKGLFEISENKNL